MDNNEKFNLYVEDIKNLKLPKVVYNTLKNDNVISILSENDFYKVKTNLIMLELYRNRANVFHKMYYVQKYKELINFYDLIQLKINNILTLCETGK